MEDMATGRDFANFASIHELLHADDALRGVELIDFLRVLAILDDWYQLLVALND